MPSIVGSSMSKYTPSQELRRILRGGVACVEAVFASPAVEIAACAREAFVGVGEGQGGSGERFAFFEGVCRVFLVDAGEKAVVVGIVGVDHYLIVAGVFEGGSDDAACVLARLSVEREHHLGVGRVRVAHAVLVLYHGYAVGQRTLLHLGFVGPAAVKARQPYVAHAHGQGGRHEAA